MAATTSQLQSTKEYSLSGRPRIKISRELLIACYDQFKDWKDVAKFLGVSESTVFRRMREYNIHKKYH